MEVCDDKELIMKDNSSTKIKIRDGIDRTLKDFEKCALVVTKRNLQHKGLEFSSALLNYHCLLFGEYRYSYIVIDFKDSSRNMVMETF